ncbi:MAG: hypothetical protein PVH82_07350 [Desulfobacteraceae bacterium]
MRGFLALAISIFLLGCQPKEDETLPPELMGVWTSPAPRFKYDTLELSKENIVFTSGRFQDFISVNFIVKVEKRPERNHVFYTIHYENIEGQKYKFSFYYYPTKGNVIRLKNQLEFEWKKVGPIRGPKRPPTPK